MWHTAEMTVRIVALAAVTLMMPVVRALDSQTAAPGGDTPLQISHRARAAAPGEVILVDIRAKALAKAPR